MERGTPIDADGGGHSISLSADRVLSTSGCFPQRGELNIACFLQITSLHFMAIAGCTSGMVLCNLRHLVSEDGISTYQGVPKIYMIGKRNVHFIVYFGSCFQEGKSSLLLAPVFSFLLLSVWPQARVMGEMEDCVG